MLLKDIKSKTDIVRMECTISLLSNCNDNILEAKNSLEFAENERDKLLRVMQGIAEKWQT